MKKSFILHLDSLDVFDELKDEEVGKLFRAIRDFEKGKEPKLDGILRAVWIPFRNQLQRDKEKYDGICDRNRENIKKRWDTKDTSGKTGIPDDTRNTHSDSKSKKESFAPPTTSEVNSYFLLKGSNKKEAEKMFNHYEAGDWKKANGVKMANWKQAAAGWIGRSKKYGGGVDQVKIDFDNRKSDRHFQNEYDLKTLKKYLFASIL